MRVLRIEYGRATAVDIDPTLESLQKQVGGYIEAIYPFEDRVGLICNEEGKILGLPWNIVIKYDNTRDIIAGNCLLCGLGSENFTDLSDELITKYVALVNKPETTLEMNGIRLPVLRATYGAAE